MAEGNLKINFDATFEYKIIYVFRINDRCHEGCLKIGDATLHAERVYSSFPPNCSELNQAARRRIDEYTATAGIEYELLYTEIAAYLDQNPQSKTYNKVVGFRDHDVHAVLKRSGIKNKYFDTSKKQNEWFVCKLETAKEAIKAVKKDHKALDGISFSSQKDPIIFRPEQEKAIRQTIRQFKSGDKMLWNAKMRFGKTLCALQVAKEKGFSKTIIITHRPVVSDGWYEDFGKIFYDSPDYAFASRTLGKPIEELVREKKKFVYFASIQDLRGAKQAGGKYPKDKEVFDQQWDFVVVDEAHEGTQTDLGQNVLKEIVKPDSTHKTCVLSLSGTPFNIVGKYEEEDIYTWDYIMEQEAKADYALNHFGDTNPYEGLPKMNIFTYHLEKTFVGYMDIEDKAFNFREFFRTWTGDKKYDFAEMPPSAKVGDFVHECDIVKFLNLISKESDKTNYPYSNEKYRKLFRHTLWVLPGVKEAKALSKLLREHPVFGFFKIVNVSGNGDEEIESKDALKAVRAAFGNDPDETYSITLTCGRLTTGVSVKEWTAVLMLAGSYSTAASQYLQTIFRVQTPATINGKYKENCYVFDFAPDRTLKIVAESVQLSTRAGKKDTRSEMALRQFLNFCPVVSIDETRMKEFKVEDLLQQLKKAYIEKVCKNGFDDPQLYNDELLKLDGVALKDFAELKKIVGASKPSEKVEDIDINSEGFSEEEYQKEENAREKQRAKIPLTDEEKRLLEEMKEKRKNRDTAISILRGISIRIPLLVYGIDEDIDSDITIDNLAEYIDNASWKEFMPKGVTKATFKKFSKYYDKDIFIGSCRRIRTISKNADAIEPTERTEKIAELFSTFKNPDKETVLTPWKVVNLHMGEAIGGYCFFDEQFSLPIATPRKITKSSITEKVFNLQSNILEVNSKTGLYPLYVAYTLYRIRIDGLSAEELTFERKQKEWDFVVANQVFVVCKTPMAKQITKRTLVGYRDAKINTRYFEDLVNRLADKRKKDSFVRKVKQGKSYWKCKEDDEMKFNAVVGNPPYQIEGANPRSAPVYPYFWDAAANIAPIVSLITPGRFLFNAGFTSDEWNEKMLGDEHLKVVKYFADSRSVFPTVTIKGGVVILLRNADKVYGKIGTFTPSSELSEILAKIDAKESGAPRLDSIIASQGLFRFSEKALQDHPEIVSASGKGTGTKIVSAVVEKLPDVFLDNPVPNEGHYIRFLARVANERAYKFIQRQYVEENAYIDCFKVFIPEGNGTGRFGESLTLPAIGLKLDGTSDTYLCCGHFSTKKECENFIKYYKTKFFRALLGIKKVTQHCPPIVWESIPIQNFEDSSDIDWNKPIEEIDAQLFAKYRLAESEMDFIRTNVESME